MKRAAEAGQFMGRSAMAADSAGMRILPALFAIPLAACATVVPPSGPVALEQAQRLGGLRITPVNVAEDSRCPGNARCVWAGRVVVRVMIEGAGDRLERNLTLGEPADVDGRSIMLDSVTPERNTGTAVSVASYRFHFSMAPSGTDAP
jgi:hypothetical protein